MVLSLAYANFCRENVYATTPICIRGGAGVDPSSSTQGVGLGASTGNGRGDDGDDNEKKKPFDKTKTNLVKDSWVRLKKAVKNRTRKNRSDRSDESGNERRGKRVKDGNENEGDANSVDGLVSFQPFFLALHFSAPLFSEIKSLLANFGLFAWWMKKLLTHPASTPR